jgi:hypothetical protein
MRACLCLFIALPALGPCRIARQDLSDEVWRKVEFDLDRLDANGLRGPPDGKVSVAYEFCIPDTPKHRAEVKALDPTVRFMPGSSGRIGAGKNECLCIGSTRKGYRRVLRGLAERPYIRRIIECHFE